METLNYIASILGLTFVVVPLALLLNTKQLEKVISSLENKVNTFCWGIIAFILGVAMILNYNVWASNWTIIITIFGWISLIKGIGLMFFPDSVKGITNKILKSKNISVSLVIFVFIGLILTYYGFTS